MSFLVYDIIFLILSCIAVVLFLYKNRKKLEIESKIIFLYKTKFGIDTIDYFGKNYPRLLNFLSYVVIVGGYGIMLFSLFSIVYLTVMMSYSTVVPKIAPIIPLIPYMPAIFKINFLPPFYFTYWIITIAIIAVGHEFSHGIFARLNKIRLKSTGFGFVGPLLAAFVELDEKQMEKKPIKAQLSVLAAGSFANLILAVVFLGLMSGFFAVSYAENGVMFNSYGLEKINISSIESINGINSGDFYFNYQSLADRNITDFEIKSMGKRYYGDYILINEQVKTNASSIILYSDTPAYKANLSGAIQKISSGNALFLTRNQKELEISLSYFKPYDNITIYTTSGEYNLTLGVHPADSKRPYLGILSFKTPENGIRKIISFFSIKNPFIYYTPKYNKELVIFIYNLLYWITLINFSVMVVNMLPFGIFDGGRFFYLTVLKITNSKKIAMLIFKIMNWITLGIMALIMIIWWRKAY